MTDEDAELQQLAHRSLARRTAGVDSHAALAVLSERLGLDGASTACSRHRWLAAAAAAVLVVGGVTALAVTRSGDERPATDPAPSVPAPSPPPSSEHVELTDHLAAAEPSEVAAGGEVTITPVGEIERWCLDQVAAFGPEATMVAVLRDGELFPVQRDGDVDALWCEDGPTGPVTFTVPPQLPPAAYVMCLTEQAAPESCADVTVTAGSGAWAEPLAVVAGEHVKITPAGDITRNCGDIITASQGGSETVGLILGDVWSYHPDVPPTQPPCLGATTGAPLEFTVPVEVDSGRWRMCIDAAGATEACAIVGVVGQPIRPIVTSVPLPTCARPTAPPTLADGSAPGEANSVAGFPGYVWAPESPHSIMQLPMAEYDDLVDEAVQGGWSSSTGRFEAVASQPVPDQPAIVALRDTLDVDRCVRWYHVPLDLDAAKRLAADWLAMLGHGAATAEPSLVTTGASVTITPDGPVARDCPDTVTVIQTDADSGHVGLLRDGSWTAFDPPFPYRAPEPYEVSGASVRFTVADNHPIGTFMFCVSRQSSLDALSDPDAGCASVTVRTAPLPACWTEPIAPPTLTDGSPPGDASLTDSGWARWGSPGAGEVQQMLGEEPHSWWFTDPSVMLPRTESGPVTAMVGALGGSPEAPRIVLIRVEGECDREYYLPDTTNEQAQVLADAWVAALAAATS